MPTLSTRMLPLRIAVALQGFMLWIPIEKLFMTEIGFDAATVGLMAASYAAFVPLVEVPSGILADRWSRRGVLIVASVAFAVCCLVCGLATDVPVYILGTLALGVYFAMFSGTLDAITYDTVLEETGRSDDFERQLGRLRTTESVMLVASSLLGGWLAGLLAPRVTYFLTIPFALLSVLAYLRFREPVLHKAGERLPLRAQLTSTYRALSGGGRLVPVVALAVLTSLTLQTLFEFGPLWLVALAVPAFVFGPYWAALVSTFGIGGLLAGRLGFARRGPRLLTITAMLLASLTLTLGVGAVPVMVAQLVLALLLVVMSIHVTRVLHDAVPSVVRSGVASGVGALTWIAFLPVAIATGLISDHFGITASGWLLTAATALTALLWTHTTTPPPIPTAPTPTPTEPATTSPK